MPLADPNTITIRRDDRQRRKPEGIDELAKSIELRGQIQEIVCAKEGDELVLIAGERRLLACRQLQKKVRYVLFKDLPPDERQLIELEENVQRLDLPWRDRISAIGKIHDIYRERDPSWTVEKTAEKIGLKARTLYDILIVFAQLNSPLVAQAQSAEQALSILQRASERRTASIVGEILAAGKAIFTKPTTSPASTPTTAPTAASSTTITASQPTAPPVAEPTPPPDPILNISFLDWIQSYSGPKFNLIHCDFPYGVGYEAFANSITQRGELFESTGDVYWTLVDSMCANLDRFVSYSAHVMFWFHMNFYEETKKRLAAAGLFVHNRPLIWMKTDNSGIVPGQGGQYPRWVYETALLCSRGKRPLIKASGDAYGAPVVANAIHPTIKPEPVLRHFFGMLVDETTDLFDPTCGSGGALRAAEDVGARSVLGLEINPEFVKIANSMTIRARAMRSVRR